MTTALSPHFSLEEMVNSTYAVRHGIDNTPSEHAITRLRNTAASLEVIRGLLRQPIIVKSGYRCSKLNNAIGGSPKSAHMAGDAADFICPAYGSPLDICRAIFAAQISYDQLIQEGTWVHISFAPEMRQELLTARFEPTGTSYTKGLG
jgi:hypothetical protein